MKVFKVVPVLLLLIYTAASITRWPTHTICKNNNLEVKYRSCDPLQDLALGVDSCSYVPGTVINIRIATILRYTINQLSVDINLILNGQTIPIYAKQLCEQNHPQFQFCGKKKGEYIYYEGPVSLNMEGIPQGEFNISAQLFNENRHTVVCAEFFIRNR
ncbi:lymphocyte antigen 86 isoform 1-T2 [Liasis olivaceus]